MDIKEKEQLRITVINTILKSVGFKRLSIGTPDKWWWDKDLGWTVCSVCIDRIETEDHNYRVTVIYGDGSTTTLHKALSVPLVLIEIPNLVYESLYKGIEDV